MNSLSKRILALLLTLALLFSFTACRTDRGSEEAGGEPTGSDIESDEESSESSEESSEEEDLLPAGNLSDWNLILLNPEEGNMLESDPDVEMVEFDGQWIDARVGEQYEAMVKAAKADGINLYLRSGFRKIELQRIYYESNVNKYMNEGHSKEEAIRLTLRYFTAPGHSEHHSGLACDIITVEYHNNIYTLDDRFGETEAFDWLMEHCTEYGFILRYPEGKTDITKINYEPWHYRYVGKEHAEYITENDLTFEEYIELLKAAGR